jgi:[NiFe] hydrogenase diaphorase moiety large subunit
MNRTKTLESLWTFQNEHGYLTDEFVQKLSKQLGISEIELEGVISFYHFFHRKPAGEYTIYLNNSIVSECKGFNRVKEAFERETGTFFGHVDPSGKFGLFETACIGLSDQEPAALINFHPVTNLTTLKVKKIISAIKRGEPLETISDKIENHLRFIPGEDKTIFMRDYHPGMSVLKLSNLGQDGVIEETKRAKIRGLGGAFFPAHIKLEACKKANGSEKYVLCNADEGEPGTFKDRILLNTKPGLILEGLIASGYAIGARQGFIYLRAEYKWLKSDLEHAIDDFTKRGFLGQNVAGIEGFDFNIEIVMGAGSYVCGEETAMINSMEGKRGEPRTKQFFPAERGYLMKPTCVFNVETLCAISRVVELGSDFFLQTGTAASPGTKLISVSGDCHKPGIYEIEWGTPVAEILEMSQAPDPFYIQVSGPSGQCISAKEFDRKISLDDIKCGGSFMIFNSKRDILKILRNFTTFFKSESCGVCTPCRAGNFIIDRKLEKIANGLAYTKDYDEIQQWGKIMGMTSRCGLGRVATNALSMAIDKFPEYFSSIVDKEKEGLNKKFNLEGALAAYEKFSD